MNLNLTLTVQDVYQSSAEKKDKVPAPLFPGPRVARNAFANPSNPRTEYEKKKSNLLSIIKYGIFKISAFKILRVA